MSDTIGEKCVRILWRSDGRRGRRRWETMKMLKMEK
jgi:hypothetical protein